eukprot:768346-Hanusia_phi.AAC.6
MMIRRRRRKGGKGGERRTRRREKDLVVFFTTSLPSFPSLFYSFMSTTALSRPPLSRTAIMFYLE